MKTLIIYFLYLSQSFATPTEFNDSHLESLLKASKKNESDVVIYSWSPHMPLSVKGLDQLFPLAKSKKILPLVVLDPNCNLELAQTLVTEHGWPKTVLQLNHSDILIQLGNRIHYPSYIFAKDGKIVSPIYPGLKSKDNVEIMIGKHLKL